MEATGFAKHHAPCNFCGFDIDKVHGGALAGAGFVCGLAIDLQATHAKAAAGGIKLHFLLARQSAGHEGSGHDGAEAFHRKCAVDRESKPPGGVLLAHFPRGGGERGAKFVDTRAGGGADGDFRCVREEGTGEKFIHFKPHQFEQIGIGKVGLRERDNAGLHSQHTADFEVLARLGLDGFIRRDHEQHHIDACGTRQHIANEALVAGHVDEAETGVLRKLKVSETEVDGDAAALLFREAVGVDSGEGADESGLAVVDVTGGTYDNVSHVRVLKYFYIAPLLALLTGSLVYCAIALVAVWRYRQSGVRRAGFLLPVSVLRPLAGAEDNTEANLRSVFAQAYPSFEVLLSVHEATDPAVAIARRLMADFPDVPARLIVAGASPMPNAKVWSLRALMPEARHEHIVMTDSDIRLEPDCLATVISELEQRNVGLVTCPYRAAGGPRFWSRVEALGLNTDFLAGMLTQRLLNGMDFAIGCTIATRKSELEVIGGLVHLQRYLAEDFVMGSLVHERGRTVVLSRSVIEHHIGNDGFVKSWRHRLRWARSTRRSRRLGYVGEIFTKPVALSLILWACAPEMWWAVVAAVLFRAAVAWATARAVLRDPLMARFWWMLPVEDVSSFATWVMGFFGKTILWRGRKLVVARDGSFEI